MDFIYTKAQNIRKMDNIQLKYIKINTPDYYEAFNLRNEVLRKPLGKDLSNEELPYEMLSFYLGAYTSEKLIGVLCWYKENANGIIKHLAVLNEYQNRGIGKALLLRAEQDMNSEHLKDCILKARLSAQGFYEKLGYLSAGPVRNDSVPHIMMVKSLA